MSKRKVRTIEKTGKKLKLQILLSTLLIVIAIIALVINTKAVVFSAIVFLGGFSWYLITRVKIWWNHE